MMKFKFNDQERKKKKKVKSFVERSFLGMTKKEVASLLGMGNNCFDVDTWYYEVNKTWWQMKTVVFICFEDDIVELKYIKFAYGKIKVSRV